MKCIWNCGGNAWSYSQLQRYGKLEGGRIGDAPT